MLARASLPFPSGARPIVGVVHLPPLPGSPGWAQAGRPAMDEVVARALADVRAYRQAGVDALVVENYGDVPFWKRVPPETVAAMTRCAREVVVAAGGLPVGVNVLRNDAHAAVAVAVAAGARFVRVNVHAGAAVTDQGLVEGEAAATLRLRDALGVAPGAAAPVAILADVLVKHARPLGPDDPTWVTRDTLERGLADGVVVSGPATGTPPDVERLRAVRAAASGAPVWLGSGLTPALAPTLAPWLDGAIAATFAMRDGRPGGDVDPDRATALVRAWREATRGRPPA